MDIIKEINTLPTFGYTFEKNGKPCLALLGGQSSKKLKTINFTSDIFRLSYDMLKLYDKKDSFLEQDKIALAKMMKQMITLCEGRLENNFTIEQQKVYLQELSEDAIHEIEYQIGMFKDAREYYMLYLH